MALVCDGSAGSYIEQTSSLPSSTGAMTILWGEYLVSDLNADSGSCEIRDSTGGSYDLHAVVTQGDGTTENLYANYGTTSASAVATLATGAWVWKALRGYNSSGDKLSLSVHPDGAGNWTDDHAEIAQTAFAPALIRFGDTGRSEPISAKFGYIRVWSSSLSDAQLSTEITSRTAVVTSGLVVDNDCMGADLTAALLGATGSAWSAPNGGVSVDTSEPSTFVEASSSIDVEVSGEIDIAPRVLITGYYASGGDLYISGTYASIDASATIDVDLLLDGVADGSGSATLTDPTWSVVIAGGGDGVYTITATITDVIATVEDMASLVVDDGSGGSAGGGTGEVTLVEIDPTSGTIELGDTLDFDATVTADAGVATTVTWSVIGGALSVDSSGTVTGEALGSGTVRATSDADPTKWAQAPITVIPVGGEAPIAGSAWARFVRR